MIFSPPVKSKSFICTLICFKEPSLCIDHIPDKTWGLVDCVSFVVMRDAGILDSLTTDKHFEQAGFRALLRT